MMILRPSRMATFNANVVELHYVQISFSNTKEDTE